MEEPQSGVVANTEKKKIIKWPYRLRLRRDKKLYPEYPKWISFYPKFHKLTLEVEIGSYFDERLQLHTQLTTLLAIAGLIGSLFISLPVYCWMLIVVFLAAPWGDIFLNLPIYCGLDQCETPSYGFYLYGEGKKVFDSVWLKWGEKIICFHMPWEWDWVRTSNLRKDGTWEHETKGNSKDFYKDEWKDVIWNESYPYTYVLKSGVVQNVMATVKVEEREWRWKGLKWSSYPSMIRKTISIEFSEEVGERKGSWKGGTVGCGYTLLPHETPLECLRRMEKERKFNR